MKSQKASAIGLIPFLGYGRGYTSLTLLEQDRRIIRNYMRDLGYRRAEVEVLQGVSISGENLIITFNVIEGPLTRIAGVEVRGNTIYTEQRLRNRLRTVIGAPFSRSQARADSERVLALYAREGYVNAQINFSVVELPKKGEEEQIRLIYSITNEGEKVFINRIIVNGVTGSAETQRTKRDAIARAITLKEGDVLRADRVSESERELYLTDAYRQVIIRTEPAGETASGFKKEDLIIDVEEKKPRVMDYGGGFSTDTGPLGLLEFSNVNLMNKLRHGAMRLRASQRQQLLRFEYVDPRFARYGERQFAPLALTVEYQRDSTVTRFFRSAIDRGTNGIVQRLDEDGNPVDEFGVPVDEPTINRFTVALETQRVLDQRTHTIVFARYSYEDVRLFNLESLLIKPILQPDRAIRLSRFGASFVRDTRERCERGLIGTVRAADGAEPGAPGEICRYNQVDATRGAFLSLDYAVALRQLGGNVSFNRFQASYRRYYKMNSLRGTVFAGNATLGLANMFNPRDRDDNGTIDEIDLTLPISERFFSGGSSTLRGFAFEEAGPRQVIIPVGVFRDQDGEIISLNPFTVPVGGNALAIVNLEARIPLTRSLQAVPFYDGGNVFRRVGDLFRKRDDTPVPPGDLLAAINAANLRARWSHTVGLGFRIQTPLGGALAIDYGFLLNPPEFLIPQQAPDFLTPLRPSIALNERRFTSGLRKRSRKGEKENADDRHRRQTADGRRQRRQQAGRQKASSLFLPSAVCRLPPLRLPLPPFRLPSLLAAQEVVDKMVATVNAGVRTDLITYSDLLWQLALQPNTSLANPSSEDLNRALRLVIDQRLILQEAEKLPTISPTDDEIRNARDQLVKVFPSAAEFQQRLLRVGLTSEKLDEILEQRVRIEKYLDFRFRNFVLISEKEIADYYQDVYVPRLRRRSPGQIIPTLEEAQNDIRATLTEAKIESDTDAFLDSARERAEIVMLSPV